jgi:hypothetical protein
MRWSLVLLCLMPWYSHAATIYLCKTYSGGTFWSSAHCGRHNALVDRTVSVPDSLPFDQQVQLGEQDRAKGAALVAPAPVLVQQQQQPQVDKQPECRALSAKIANIDTTARQPQTGQMQDWLTQEKRKARDRQFQLRC